MLSAVNSSYWQVVSGLVCILAIMMSGGCTTDREKQQGEVTRSGLANPQENRPMTFRVVTAQYDPELRITTPGKGWILAAGRGAVVEGRDTFSQGMKYFGAIPCKGGARGCAPINIVNLAYTLLVLTGSSVAATVGGIKGGVEGAIAAPDPTAVDEAEERVRKARNDLKIQESMAAELVGKLRGIPPHHRFEITATEGPQTPEAEPQYEALVAQSVDMVVESRVQTLWLEEGRMSVDPQLHIGLRVAMRVVRVNNGIVLYSASHDYQGNDYTAEKWAANEGELFSGELNNCYENIAEAFRDDLWRVRLK